MFENVTILVSSGLVFTFFVSEGNSVEDSKITLGTSFWSDFRKGFVMDLHHKMVLRQNPATYRMDIMFVIVDDDDRLLGRSERNRVILIFILFVSPWELHWRMRNHAEHLLLDV